MLWELMSSLKKEVQQYIECCDCLLDDAMAFTLEEQQFLLYYADQITNAVRVKVFSHGRSGVSHSSQSTTS